MDETATAMAKSGRQKWALLFCIKNSSMRRRFFSSRRAITAPVVEPEFSDNLSVDDDVLSPVSSPSRSPPRRLRAFSESKGTVKVTRLEDCSVQTELSTSSGAVTFSESSNRLVSTRFKRYFVHIFLIYLLLCFLLCISSFVQSVFIYMNVFRWPLTNAELRDLNTLGIPYARNIQFQTDDGLSIRGYHIPPLQEVVNSVLMGGGNINDEASFDDTLANSKRIIIFFHGNAATRGFFFRINLVKQLSSLLKAHVISWDYRGFGDSEGWPSEKGIAIDSVSLMKWLTNDIIRKHNRNRNNSSSHCITHEDESIDNNSCSSFPKIYLYGQSLGAAIATELAVEINNNQEKKSTSLLPIDGLILDSPFSSLVEATKSHPAAWLFRVFPLIERLL
jgi:pimeloyl-ACP methyl ester carboxylesterase